MALLVAGLIQAEGSMSFKPLQLLGMDPIVWGVLASGIAGIGVSLLTAPPEPERISQLFDAQPPAATSPLQV
jgi:hypothetical protein